VNAITLFGLFAVTAMLVCYALEKRNRWFTLAFAVSCILGSVYGFLQGAWPFGLVETVWAMVAARRWFREKSSGCPTSDMKYITLSQDSSNSNVVRNTPPGTGVWYKARAIGKRAASNFAVNNIL
jgi:hypothetical protein